MTLFTLIHLDESGHLKRRTASVPYFSQVSVEEFRIKIRVYQKNAAVLSLKSSKCKNSFSVHFYISRLITPLPRSDSNHPIIHNGRLQVVSSLLTKVSFCWWIMNICHHVHITCEVPNHCCHVTTCPDPNVTLFQLQHLASEVVGHSHTV